MILPPRGVAGARTVNSVYSKGSNHSEKELIVSLINGDKARSAKARKKHAAQRERMRKLRAALKAKAPAAGVAKASR